MSAVKYWIWLASRGGVGNKSTKRMLEVFPDAEKLYFARERDYKAAGFTPQEIRSLMDKDLAPARKVIEACGRLNIQTVTYGDPLYPERLKNIFDPPVVLYCRGTLPVIDDEPVVGIVGTRKCTEYGYKTAERIGYEYAKLGGIVATGLAKGVDSAAARGALVAGGRVIGVTGSGLDIVYPPENAGLFREVEKNGVIISEFEPGTPPVRKNFPQRNRLISGISVAAAVIEAPRSSGALITAMAALEQGRDVFAVPGNVDAAACVGTNRLLREGACALVSGRDLAEAYIGRFPDKLSLAKRGEELRAPDGKTRELSENEIKCGKKCPEQSKKEIDKDEVMEYIDLVTAQNGLSEDEAAVLRAIADRTVHIDEIIEKSGLRAGSALAALTMLEIKGVVSQTEGKKFSFTPLK